MAFFGGNDWLSNKGQVRGEALFSKTSTCRKYKGSLFVNLLTLKDGINQRGSPEVGVGYINTSQRNCLFCTFWRQENANFCHDS